jgi:hypothetical protein
MQPPCGAAQVVNAVVYCADEEQWYAAENAGMSATLLLTLGGDCTVAHDLPYTN